MKLSLTLWMRQQDTVLTVWRGAPLLDGSNVLGCNDEFCGNISQVTVTLTANTAYTIIMSHFTNGYTWPSTPINLTIVSSGDGELGLLGPAAAMLETERVGCYIIIAAGRV
jgi:hypothetical protein